MKLLARFRNVGIFLHNDPGIIIFARDVFGQTVADKFPETNEITQFHAVGRNRIAVVRPIVRKHRFWTSRCWARVNYLLSMKTPARTPSPWEEDLDIVKTTTMYIVWKNVPNVLPLFSYIFCGRGSGHRNILREQDWLHNLVWRQRRVHPRNPGEFQSIKLSSCSASVFIWNIKFF